MARTPQQPPQPITAADIREAISQKSDFAFELLVLNTLTSLGLKCQHGGTYSDPIKGIPRQFDIRARQQVGRFFNWFAIECKSLTVTNPLVVLTVPRKLEECYHYVALNHKPEGGETRLGMVV